MREFRKRFVQMNMLLIGLVLFLMLAAIAVYMSRDQYITLRSTMSQVVGPLDSFSQPRDGLPPHRGEDAPLEELREKELAPHHPRQRQGVMAVFYTPETGEVAVLSPDPVFSGDDLDQLLKAVVAQDSSFGVLYGHHAFYYRTGGGAPYRIALASTDYLTRSVLRLTLVLLGVWVGAMLCFLLVSVQLSKVAVRPMEEAMDRERQFVADASHDLKTPLSVILANTSILRENPQATVESVERWVDSTQAAADNMLGLIGEMLTLADVERRDVPLRLEQVDVSAAVTKAALQLESVAYEKGVCLDTEIPEGLCLRTDEDYFQRIAAGLMENAIKYEPPGGQVRVELTRKRRHLCLRVENQHAVIDPADLPHLFDRFYRGDKSRHSDCGGHGLGLSITKEMVERLGGTISAAGDPAAFQVVFPL